MVRHLGLLALAVGVNGQVNQAINTGMSFIIRTLEEAKTEIVEMNQQEATQHSRFAQYCTQTEGSMEDDIARFTATHNKQQAISQTDASNSKTSTEAAAEADTLVNENTADLKRVTAERGKQNDEFVMLNTDYSESVKAIKGAITFLHTQDAAVTAADAAPALLQTVERALQSSGMTSAATTANVLALVQMQAEAVPQSDAVIYEKNTSQGVIDMLEKLLAKFQAEKTAIVDAEKVKANNFNQLATELKETIAGGEHDAATSKSAAARHAASSAAAGSLVKAAEDSRQASTKALKDLVQDCKQTTALFQRRHAGQSKDIEAFENAISVLSGDTPAFLQTGRSFLQLGRFFGLNSDVDFRLQKMRDFLKQEGDKLHNAALMQLATNQDPFQKVTNMIKGLIARLVEEAAEEEGEQQWCNGELGKNEEARTDQSTKVETQQTKITNQRNIISSQTETIEGTETAVVTLEKEKANMSELRGKAKSLFEKTKGELETMVSNLGTAVEHLEAAAAFIQLDHQYSSIHKRQQPAVDFDEEYTSQGGNIIQMLDNLKLSTETELREQETAESLAAVAFSTQTKDWAVDETKHKASITAAKTARNTATSTMEEGIQDLETAQQLLSDANAYNESLQEKCVRAQSAEERAKGRNEEIASLKQALSILNGDDST